MKSVRELPDLERPRERLIRFGPDTLSDAQLLAIIIRTGSRQRTVIDTAYELLQKFGGLKGLDEASVQELRKYKGLGIAKVAQIKAAFELGKRLLTEKVNEQVFNSAYTVFRYCAPKLTGLKKESFIALLLDTKLRLIREVKVSEGILNQSLVHPREVFKEAVRDSAYALILVHNHPSGDPSPSESDLKITERLKKASEIIEIPILDHVIIGRDSYFSMKENGIL